MTLDDTIALLEAAYAGGDTTAWMPLHDAYLEVDPAWVMGSEAASRCGWFWHSRHEGWHYLCWREFDPIRQWHDPDAVVIVVQRTGLFWDWRTGGAVTGRSYTPPCYYHTLEEAKQAAETWLYARLSPWKPPER